MKNLKVFEGVCNQKVKKIGRIIHHVVKKTFKPKKMFVKNVTFGEIKNIWIANKRV